ncbi:hypothetical protein M758_8G174600 [Ceratodon purpureus]|nr:hypothetical protein M758_8G174600 [Ceratodon purpureus]KAG0609304.1 hypothetical protein M758_8G174600 [Ceratodon purpureus]
MYHLILLDRSVPPARMETQPGHTPASQGEQLMDSTSSSRRINKPMIWSSLYGIVPENKFLGVTVAAFSSNQRRDIKPYGAVKRMPNGEALHDCVPVQGTRLLSEHRLGEGVFFDDMVAVGFTAPVSSTVSPGILRSALSPAVPRSEIESAVPLFEDEDSVTTLQKLWWMFLSTELEHHGFDVMSLRPNWNPVVAVAILLGSHLCVSLHESTKTRVVVGSATGVKHEIDSSESIQLSPGDQCIIMGTPGLWTYLTAEEAVDIARGVGCNSDTASDLLVKTAVERMNERHSSVEKNKGISESEGWGNDTPTFDYNNISDITATVIFLDVDSLIWPESTAELLRYNEIARQKWIYRGLLRFSRVVNECFRDGSIDNMMKLKVMEEEMEKRKTMVIEWMDKEIGPEWKERMESNLKFEEEMEEERMMRMGRMEKAKYDEKLLLNDPILNSNYEQQAPANVLCPPPKDISQQYEDNKKIHAESKYEIQAGLETSVGIQAPVQDTRPLDLICCFNKEAKHFEFYFKNSETMARTIGVGVEYAKVIISDQGMKVRAIEIPKEDWESMWKNDEGLPPQIWENKPKSEKVFSADGEAWKPFLWHIAEFCTPIVERMMSSSKDTQTDADNFESRTFGPDGCNSEGKDNCDASNGSEVRDGAGAGDGGSNGEQDGGAGAGGSGSNNGENGEGGGDSGSNGGPDGGGGGGGGSNGGQDRGAGGGGGGGGNSKGGHTKAVVELVLLPGGLLYASKSKDIVDSTRLPLGENLSSTICPILKFTFIKDGSDKKLRTEIETIVETRFEFPGENINNYRNIGRLGWYHTGMEVSFGVEDNRAKLSTCKPLDYELLKVSLKKATTATDSENKKSSWNVGLSGGPSVVNTKAGYGRENAKNKSHADTDELQCEDFVKVTKGRFQIKEYANKELMKTRCTPVERLPCLDHDFLSKVENLNKALTHAISEPQVIKSAGTWQPWYKSNDNEYAKYNFVADRDLQMTTARPQEGEKPPLTRFWHHKKKEEATCEEAQVNEPFHLCQKYERSIYLNQDMGFLKSATFEFDESRCEEGLPGTHSMSEASSSQEPILQRLNRLSIVKTGNIYIAERQYPEHRADWCGLRALVLSQDGQ